MPQGFGCNMAIPRHGYLWTLLLFLVNILTLDMRVGSLILRKTTVPSGVFHPGGYAYLCSTRWVMAKPTILLFEYVYGSGLELLQIWIDMELVQRNGFWVMPANFSMLISRTTRRE